jgi:hypothetical protein
VHILTKIFVVLVSLLAIFMVPLVVVSTMNQEHWRRDALDMQTQVSAAQSQQRTVIRSSRKSLNLKRVALLVTKPRLG